MATPDEITAEIPELSELGVDPVETPMSWIDFGHLLRRKKMKLKAFLTDQTIMAGIGNIYTDEILFDAGLRYDRVTDTLSTQEIRRLYRALVETLHEAIKYGGSTLGDGQYVDLYGKPGELPEPSPGLRPREASPVAAAGALTSSRSSSPTGPPTSARLPGLIAVCHSSRSGHDAPSHPEPRCS